MNSPADRAAFADQSARQSDERAARESPEHAEVLTYYGSEEAALTWTKEEMRRTALQRSFEFGGVEFTNGEAPGVRLRVNHKAPE